MAKNWNPDKTDEAGIDNELRADRARRALNAYLETKGESDTDEADITDLIADLLHLAAAEEIDTEPILRVAEINFESERS